MNALLYAPNWLGDAVMAMPALQVWRARHPGDRLVVLTKRGNAPLWRMHPAVDEVLELAPGTRGTFRTGLALRPRRFDVAYLLPNSFRSALIAFLAGIPRRRGFARHARSLLLTERVRPARAPGDYHQSRETAPILLGDDLPAALPPPDLRVPPELVEKTVGAFLKPAAGDAGGPANPRHPPRFVALIPGAARGDSKRWPHFAEAARLLAEADPALRFVVLGTKAEAALCRRVADGDARFVVAAGETTLPEFAALLSAAATVVCNDSGGMHLAAATGAPVVAVFGLTDWRRTGPLGTRAAVVRRPDVEARRAIARTSAEAAAVLASIPPDQVAREALTMLSSPS